jgi:hypothetical protein
MAMGEIEVFRNCRDNRHFSTKKIARVTAACFIVVWCAASVLAFVNGVVVHPTDKTLKQKNASQSNAGGK